MIEPIRIAIGYDPSEAVAYHVLCHSIMMRSSRPVSFIPLQLNSLRPVHKRKRHPLQSTEFSFTRFLTPYLTQYTSACVIYMDCDMLVLDDIATLVSIDPLAPVSVVHHQHKPVSKTKMLDQVQTQYPMKNQSSLMVFWPGHMDCRKLTPEYVDTAEGLDLHQFKWASRIGRLPFSWNHLVGYDEIVPNTQISCLHWTEGGPWWDESVPYADVWFKERTAMMAAWERKRATA